MAINIINEENIPEDLIVKTKKDLITKLEEGEQDIENGDVCSVDELYAELQKILTD